MSQIIEDLKKESDEDLLVYISMVDEPEVRNAAFTEFHRRFKDFLWNLITQICSSHYDSDDLAKAVFQNTLIAVSQYSHTFDTNGETNREQIAKKLYGWLTTIAKNETKRLLIESKNNINRQEDDGIAYQSMIANAKQSVKNTSKYLAAIESAVKRLSERDQHIVLTYWQYYEHGNGSQAKNMPARVLDELASKYSTTKANIRKIIERGNKAIKEDSASSIPNLQTTL